MTILQQINNNNSLVSTVATAADNDFNAEAELLSVSVFAVLLSVIITGGIVNDLSVNGLIEILPILISGLIINLILIIQ